jgi:hypothetical protein
MKQSGENIKRQNGSAFFAKKINTSWSPQKKEPYSEGCAAMVFDIKEGFFLNTRQKPSLFSSFGSAIGDITIILNT